MEPLNKCVRSLSLSLCGSLNNNLMQYVYFLFVDSWENEFFLLFLGDQTEPYFFISFFFFT